MSEKTLKPDIYKSTLTEHLPDLLAIVFFAIITVKYPLLFVAPFPGGLFSTSLFMSTIEVLSVFSLFMILLRFQKLIDLISGCNMAFWVAIFSFLSICIVQFFSWNSWTFKEFSFAVSWISIPFAVYLYTDIFKKYLLGYLAFLWIFSMIHTVYQLIISTQCVGISGNRNWHGAFLIATTPFFVYWLYRFLKKKNANDQKIRIVLSAVSALSLYALFMAESRGANLAFILGILLALGLYLNRFENKRQKKLGRLYLLTIFIVIIFGIIIGPLLYGYKLAAINAYDVRVPLWRGAMNMFIDNFGLGVGAAGYEGEYAYYIPIERFLRSHYFAGRATHPHNQWLFFAGAYGWAGVIAISYLWVAPMVIFLKNYQNTDALSKLYFFSFFMLSIHCMFDLVLMRWPTMQIALILQGILWSYAYKTQTKKTISNEFSCSYSIRIICRLAAAICLGFSLLLMFENLKSSYYGRNSVILADAKKYSLSLQNTQQAINLGNGPEDLYHAGMKSLFWFEDYRLAYLYFSKLDKHPAKIVGYSNARIAECLIKMNRKHEALIYCDRHIKAFPLSSLAVYNKLLLERDLGKDADAAATANKLLDVMRFKGLKLEDMHKILKNPELDNRFEKLQKQQ